MNRVVVRGGDEDPAVGRRQGGGPAAEVGLPLLDPVVWDLLGRKAASPRIVAEGRPVGLRIADCGLRIAGSSVGRAFLQRMGVLCFAERGGQGV